MGLWQAKLDIIWRVLNIERKKDMEEIGKIIEKYTQKNVRIVYNFLCAYVSCLYLPIIVCRHIIDI